MVNHTTQSQRNIHQHEIEQKKWYTANVTLNENDVKSIKVQEWLSFFSSLFYLLATWTIVWLFTQFMSNYVSIKWTS